MGFTMLMMSGTISQGITARGQADAQAILLDDQARQEREAGMRDAEVIRRAAERTAASARTAAAASGVVVDTGSAALATDYITQTGGEDALTAILTGERRASATEGEAKQTRLAGRAAQKASYISAMSQGMQGAYGYGKSTGWRANGPGYSNSQTPAPVETRTITVR